METVSFKTKTMFTNRSDKQLKGVYPVALDIGYSGVKIFSPNKVGVFPSYARPYVNNGTVGKLPDDYIVYKDLDSGENWLVGNMAQTDVNVNEAIDSDEAIYGRQRYFDPMFKVISRVGLGIAMMPNKYAEIGSRRLVVQTGLPPKYTSDSTILRQVLSGTHNFSVQIGSNKPVEFHFELKPEDIHIIIQPMGTLYSAAINSEHRFTNASTEYLSKNVLIFDAGFGTFDLFLIKNHSIKNSESFSNLGMKQVFKETSDAIYQKYGEKVSVSEMQRLLKTGYVRTFDRQTFSTKDEPFGDLLEAASEKVCMNAIEKMAQIYPLQEMDYLIITGGTGAAWENMIRSKFKNMQTLNILSGNQNETTLPFVFANARGYYMYLFSILEKEIMQKEG